MPRKKSFKGAAGKFALQNRRKGGGFNPFSVFRSLFASSADRKPLTNKMSTTETAIWYMLFYYFVGSGLYTRLFEKQFTTHESIYFLTVTMTTTGFGDYYPTSRRSRIFTMLWVIFGVSCVAAAMVEIAGAVMDAREAILREARNKILSGKGGAEKENADDQEAAGLRSGVLAPFKRVLNRFPILEYIAYLTMYAFAVGALFSIFEEDWTLIDGLYFSVISGTAIGYGDIVPQSIAGQTLFVVYIPFAVVFVSSTVMNLGRCMLMSSENESALDKLLKKDLSLEALLAMDEDGDGEITEYEFLRFMLGTAEIVDEEVLDAIHACFEKLDADGGGTLNAEDLKVEPLGLGNPGSKDHVVDEKHVKSKRQAFEKSVSKVDPKILETARKIAIVEKNNRVGNQRSDDRFEVAEESSTRTSRTSRASESFADDFNGRRPSGISRSTRTGSDSRDVSKSLPPRWKH